jgi:glycerol-3-phosphate O-acyltransferase / dihydroxyacetone phosphate acyltransferase
MLYRALRWVASIALRWFYRRIDVIGVERVPASAPLLIAANHPNQLLDALLVGYALRRPVTFTGKAILLDNPFVGAVMRRLPFVPLRRASDERKRAAGEAARNGGAPPDPARNTDAFRQIIDVLAAGGAVLVFPEGISHNQPQLAPIKTGIARMALQARDERGIRDVHILPVGLTFERKEVPRTRVLVEIGEPLAVDRWTAAAAPTEALTREVSERLHAVTLNFPTREAADRVRRVAEVLTGVFADVRPLGEGDGSLAEQVEVTRRVESARQRLADLPAAESVRVTRFQQRLDEFTRELNERGVEVRDLDIPLGWLPAARFLLREGVIAAAAGPLALWGRVNHWLPLRLARGLAARSSRSPEDPAMHTVVIGLASVLLFYAVQTTVVGVMAGPWWALAYLASLVPSADWDFRYQDRRRRAVRRMRTFLRLRRAPAVCARLAQDAAWLREEATSLERLTTERTPSPPAAAPTSAPV